MAAISKHKYDVYRWIERVIESCTTYRQLLATERLLDAYDIMYEDDYLYGSLKTRLGLAWDELFKNVDDENI